MPTLYSSLLRLCINIPMLRILFFSTTRKITHHRHHKRDLNLHYHPLIYGTVCCAAGMLMYQHSSSVNVVLKMQDLVTKAKRLDLLPTKNQSRTQHVNSA